MSVWFYADKETKRLVTTSSRVVYLYGGFEGFDNYGDIIQLNGAIRFHRNRSNWPIVLVVSLASHTHHLARPHIYSKFDADGVIWEDGELLDTTSLELEVVTEVVAGGLLHVYGGGYFNRYWGARRAYVCEQLILRLHVRHYVLSGLQVDELGASYLGPIFRSKRPLLIAARDRLSAESLQGVAGNVDVQMSFDDAVEPILDLKLAFASHGGLEEPIRPSIGLHVNITSEYMAQEQASEVRTVFESSRNSHPDHGLVLLHAYNDRRPEILDTIPSIVRLSLLDSLTQFEAVNFATLAGLKSATPRELRAVARSLSEIEFVITSSYHVALTMNLLGKPAYLVASNDYYAEKREALGLPGDISQFLRDPRQFLTAFPSQRRSRADWLQHLDETLALQFDSDLGEKWSTMNPDDRAPTGEAESRYLIQ